MVKYYRKTTFSLAKCDVGSLTGHHAAPEPLSNITGKNLEKAEKGGLSGNYHVSNVEEDLQLSAKKALELIYGAGQDLLKTAFSGNVRGMGPGVAEMEMEEGGSDPTATLAAEGTSGMGHPRFLLNIASVFAQIIILISTILDLIIIQYFLYEKYGGYVAGICTGVVLTLLAAGLIFYLSSRLLNQNAKTGKLSTEEAHQQS